MRSAQIQMLFPDRGDSRPLMLFIVGPPSRYHLLADKFDPIFQNLHTCVVPAHFVQNSSESATPMWEQVGM